MKPMSLAEWSNLAQVIGTVVVIVSLIFIGLQIRQNTSALQRNEHNSTMEQWTVIRTPLAMPNASVGTASITAETNARCLALPTAHR
jgi:hypothetical protein